MGAKIGQGSPALVEDDNQTSKCLTRSLLGLHHGRRRLAADPRPRTVEAAFRENKIDDAILPKLTADDLKDLGVGIVGHLRKLLEAIAALHAEADAKAPPAQVFSPIESATREIAERRQVTVMFADLGLTPE